MVATRGSKVRLAPWVTTIALLVAGCGPAPAEEAGPGDVGVAVVATTAPLASALDDADTAPAPSDPNTTETIDVQPSVEATPRPTREEPAVSPSPTGEPPATEAPRPEPTDADQGSAASAAEPEPVATPAPTPTPEAAAVAESTATPEPTEAESAPPVEPTATAQPTVTSEPTPTPTPDPTPTSSPAAAPDAPYDAALAPLVDMARADLVATRGVDANQVVVELAELRTWPDASAGCPIDGFAYAQVPTEGTEIILRVDASRYRYVTGGDRWQPFLCQQNR